jgi:hypothetical protein
MLITVLIVHACLHTGKFCFYKSFSLPHETSAVEWVAVPSCRAVLFSDEQFSSAMIDLLLDYTGFN